MKPQRALWAIAFYIVIAGIIGWISADSLNPSDVYRGSGWIAKVMLTIVLAAIAAQAFTLLGLYVLRGVIGVSSGRPADDVRCACHGQPLILTISLYGAPVKCSHCARWWHQPSFNADVPAGALAKRVVPCALCRQERADQPIDFDNV